MRAKKFAAIFLTGMMLLPAVAWAQRSGPGTRAESQSESCLYAPANGRWTGMPGVRRVEGTAKSPEIRFAGQVGRISVNVTDFRCDNIAYEITLLASKSEEFSSFASLLRKIEGGTKNSNFSKLSAANLRTLERDKKVSWKNADEFGEITIETTEYSTIVRAYYSGYQ